MSVWYSVQFSHSVVSDSLRTAACQASLSITSSRNPPKLMSIESVMPSTVSSSVTPFSSFPQSFPASESFPVSQFFTSGGQSIGVSASASVLPMNTQGWSPLGRSGWISLQSKGLSRVFSNTTVQKASIFRGSAFFIGQLSHPYMTTGKTIALTRQTFVGKVMSLLFNRLSRLVMTFLPRSKCLNFMAAIIICRDFGAQKNSQTLFPLFPHLFAITCATLFNLCFMLIRDFPAGSDN